MNLKRFARRIESPVLVGHASAGSPPSELAGRGDTRATAFQRFMLVRANANAQGKALPGHDLRRIIALPIIGEYDDEIRKEYQHRYVQAHALDRGWSLWNTQVDSIIAFDQFKGGFFPIGVGWGKTIIGQLSAVIAKQRGIERTVLFLQPNLYGQFMMRDIAFARHHLNLYGLSFYGLGQLNTWQRKAYATSGRPGCYVLPYSLLSTRDTEDIIEWINPGCVVADEVHNLKRMKAARTRRLMYYLKKKQPWFVGMSGTVTDKGIMDYHHTLKHALHDNMPLPLSPSFAVDWAVLLDSSSDPETSNMSILKKLLDWANDNRPEAQDLYPYTPAGLRYAYRRRLTTSPGVIATGYAEIKVSLTIANTRLTIPTDEAGKKLKELEAQVRDAWITPNGDPIAHAINTWKWLHELSAGFYNMLRWPKPEQIQKSNNCDLSDAKDLLKAAQEQHECFNEFTKELRAWLEKYARRNLDTPFLVEADMAKYGPRNVGPELYELWKLAKDQEFPGMPERESLAVRVCPYKIDHAVKWANEQPHGIIWYYHKEIGQWLRERLPKALWCPAGQEYDARILDSRDRIVLASIAAHGQGKNLQFHQNQLVIQTPRSAVACEQMLGRTHRNGQDADELIVGTCHSTEFDDMNYAAMLGEALYIQQTTGSRQKPIICGYDPLPPLFPIRVLQERGFEPKFGHEQEQTLKERFSPTA